MPDPPFTMTRHNQTSLALALLSGNAVPAFNLKLAAPANDNRPADVEPRRAPQSNA